MKQIAKIGRFYILIFFLSFYGYSFSQIEKDTNKVVVISDTINYYDMNLEQLQQLKGMGVSTELEKLINSLISVASKKSLSTRETPGIVSLITAEDIKNWGCRDLIDALKFVPGLDFGVDVQGVVGIGARGNWGHEGKILVLVDGQEMNDILWGTTQFGNHFPIENIQKIEVIRGPGSSIYGGFAELGVINIVTKKGEDINGIKVSGIYGQMSSSFARRNGNLMYGQKFKSGLDVSLNAFMGQGIRSSLDYTDAYGSSYNMTKSSNLNPAQLNFGLSYKGLSIRTIYDDYKTTMRDAYGANTTEIYPNNFKTVASEIKYIAKVNEKLSITSKVNYLNQRPWYNPIASNDEYSQYIRTSTRYRGGLSAQYKVNRKLTFTLGGETYKDVAIDLIDDVTFETGSDTVSYFNYAAFGELMFKHRIFNLTLGARYDKHNVYGDAFNPRIALTKKIKRTHFKILYSHGFRAPAIENINYSLDGVIKPEKLKIGEIEVGHQITRDMILTANVFYLQIKDAIIYGAYDVQDDTLPQVEVYLNDTYTGTYGVDLDLKVKKSWGSLLLNYSYYSANGLIKPEAYTVPDKPGSMLGFPQHKVNFSGVYNLGKRFTLNSSVNFIGTRYSFTKVDSLDNGILETFKPKAFLNMTIRYENESKNFNASLGVMDIFNQVFYYLQPYNSMHAALPGNGREIVMKLSYLIPLNSKIETNTKQL